MYIRLTSEADGRVCMESPYDPNFIAEFKQAIPYDGRVWETTRKRWFIDPRYVPDLLAFCQEGGVTVRDERGGKSALPKNPYAHMPESLRASFACLFLAPNAPICVAEASYKALSRVFHPDMPDGSHATMQRINEAISTIRSYLK